VAMMMMTMMKKMLVMQQEIIRRPKLTASPLHVEENYCPVLPLIASVYLFQLGFGLKQRTS
jgi:hypothetical protein